MTKQYYKIIEMYEATQTLFVVQNTTTKEIQSVWNSLKDARSTVSALNFLS